MKPLEDRIFDCINTKSISTIIKVASTSNGNIRLAKMLMVYYKKANIKDCKLYTYELVLEKVKVASILYNIEYPYILKLYKQHWLHDFDTIKDERIRIYNTISYIRNKKELKKYYEDKIREILVIPKINKKEEV